MKAGRGIYDRDDISVTIARPTRSNNWYKKARKWDRVSFNTWGKLKLVGFPLGKRIWWFSLPFSPCGFQGKLKLFLLSFGFTVSLLRFYFVYTHWNSASVSIRRKFEICKLVSRKDVVLWVSSIHQFIFYSYWRTDNAHFIFTSWAWID